MDVQRSARKGTFVTAVYTNVDFSKLSPFVNERESRSGLSSLVIPERAPILDAFTYPIWVRLSEEADPDQMVEPEYVFTGLSGKVSGTWDEARKQLMLQFVVHET